MEEEKPKYRVELAKTGRSTCKASKEKIAEGQLRLGCYADIHGHGSYQWRSLHHITPRLASNVEKKVGNYESVDGFDELAAAQQLEFLDAMEAALGKTKAGAKAKARAKSRALAMGLSRVAARPVEPISQVVELEPLLVSLGIPAVPAAAYAETFKREGFDCVASLRTLTESDLEQMGLLTGHRRLLMQHFCSSEPGDAACSLAGFKRGPGYEQASASPAPTSLQTSAALRRWKRACGGEETVTAVSRSRSQSFAEETGLDIEEARLLLRESDAATGPGL